MTMSPCVRICKVDDSDTYCLGCFRTLSEVSSWQWMTEEEQAFTIGLTELRRTAHNLDKEHGKQATKKAGRVKPCTGHDTQG
jgi:uncharacterized protein